MSDDAEFLVKVDLDKLHVNLSRTWRQRVTPQDTHDFLIQAGFRPVEDGWIAAEHRLMLLDPSEVISAERIGESSQ